MELLRFGGHFDLPPEKWTRLSGILRREGGSNALQVSNRGSSSGDRVSSFRHRRKAAREDFWHEPGDDLELDQARQD